MDAPTGMGQPLPNLHQPDLPEFNLTSARRHSRDSGSPKDDDKRSSQEWQTIEHGRAKKKAKRVPKPQSSNYPAIEFSESSRLNSQIKISDLQNLVLYILTDGTSPQFVSVRHRSEIRKVVVLMVPGLEKSMFDILDNGPRKKETHDGSGHTYTSPDDYYPIRLNPDKMPASVQAFADMFPHIWPVKTPGDDKYAKMHSPLHAMLTAPQQKSKEEKKWSKDRKGASLAREPQGWKNTRTPIPEFIHSPEDLLENEYTLHPAAYNGEAERAALTEHRRSIGVSPDHGWVDTEVKRFDDGTPPESEIESGSLTAGREVLAMDCEMCMTGENEFSLTRISIVGWDGSVVLDELVKPDKPIINYLTQYVFPFYVEAYAKQ
jgi:RNA exonuclease 1